MPLLLPSGTRQSAGATQTGAMPFVTAETLGNGNLTGAVHGGTISLIFDHSDPEADDDFTAARTTDLDRPRGQHDLPSRG